MMSGAQLLGTNTGRFVPHIMIYIPYATNDQLGTPPPGCDQICMFEHEGGPFAALIVPMKEFIELGVGTDAGR
jgi:hypothetical protein